MGNGEIIEQMFVFDLAEQKKVQLFAAIFATLEQTFDGGPQKFKSLDGVVDAGSAE